MILVDIQRRFSYGPKKEKEKRKKKRHEVFVDYVFAVINIRSDSMSTDSCMCRCM